jgi:hypothetical protein
VHHYEQVPNWLHCDKRYDHTEQRGFRHGVINGRLLFCGFSAHFAHASRSGHALMLRTILDGPLPKPAGGGIIMSMGFSVDGMLLAAGDNKGAVHIWVKKPKG